MSANIDQSSADQEFKFSDVIDSIIQYRWPAGFVATAIILLGVVYCLVAAPVYTADVLIQVEAKKGSSLAGIQQLASALDLSDGNALGEIDVIKSREVVGKAIQEHNLDIEVRAARRIPFVASNFERKAGGRGQELNDPRFGMTNWAWGGEQLVISRFEVPFRYLDTTFRVVIASPTSFRLLDDDGDTLASGNIAQDVPFSLPHNLHGVINIGEIFARPTEGFRITKRSASYAYNELLEKLKAAETVRQSSVIKVSLDYGDPRDAVAILDDVADAYVKQNVNRNAEDAERALKFLEAQLPVVKTGMESSEEALSKFQVTKETMDLDKEADSLLTRSVDLEKSRVEAEMKRQQLLELLNPDHPQVRAATDEINKIKQEEDALGVQVRKLPNTAQSLLTLKRDVRVNTDIFTNMLSNSEQLKVTRASSIGNVRIVDLAEVNNIPTRPKIPLILSACIIFGIISGIVTAVLLRNLRPTIRSVDELERTFGLPIYCTIPESDSQGAFFRKRATQHLRRRLLHDTGPSDPAMEAIRSMRIGLQFAITGSQNNRVLITGPSLGTGKSFFSANLAAALASAGKKVLIVDTDLRRPRLHRYFGLQSAPGLSNVLAGDVSVLDVVQQDVLSGLFIITAGPIPLNPSELIMRGQLDQILSELGSSYDFVIVDSAPLLPVGDAIYLSKISGITLLVVRAEHSTLPEVGDCLTKLRNAGTDAKGLVLNAVPHTRLGNLSRYRYYNYAETASGQ